MSGDTLPHSAGEQVFGSEKVFWAETFDKRPRARIVKTNVAPAAYRIFCFLTFNLQFVPDFVNAESIWQHEGNRGADFASNVWRQNVSDSTGSNAIGR
jgi:hypothetical protein